MSRRGFTLIELLVAISIVGLLSSVVVASLNSAREKSRIGSIRYFASQVDHMARDQAVGIWNFDECSNTAATDISGFGNDGSIISASSSSDTPNGYGCSVLLNGTTGYINLGNPSGGLFDLGTDDLSVAIWFKSSVANNGGLIQKKQNGGASNSGWKLGFRVSDGNQFQSLVSDGVAQAGSSYNLAAVTNGLWHHAVLVIDRAAGQASIYVDGVRRSSASISSVGSVSTSYPFYVGVDNGSNFFNGLVDDVRIYRKSLTASEVGRMYAEADSGSGFARAE